MDLTYIVQGSILIGCCYVGWHAAKPVRFIVNALLASKRSTPAPKRRLM